MLVDLVGICQLFLWTNLEQFCQKDGSKLPIRLNCCKAQPQLNSAQTEVEMVYIST